MSFYKLPDGTLLNVLLVRRAVYNAARDRTEFYYDHTAHNFMCLPGDHRDAILAAARNEQPKSTRR
jgi:hypothetical protein